MRYVPGGAVAGGATATGGALAQTGASVGTLIVVAIVSIVIGTVLVAYNVRRRRREARFVA